MTNKIRNIIIGAGVGVLVIIFAVLMIMIAKKPKQNAGGSESSNIVVEESSDSESSLPEESSVIEDSKEDKSSPNQEESSNKKDDSETSSGKNDDNKENSKTDNSENSKNSGGSSENKEDSNKESKEDSEPKNDKEESKNNEESKKEDSQGGSGSSGPKEWTEIRRVEPTCESVGVIVYQKGTDTKQEQIPALGHDWKLVSTDEATCNKNGAEHYECSRCHETKDETLAKTAHKEVEKIEITTPASCEKEGVKTIKVVCEVCQKEISSREEKIPALEHEWDMGTIKKKTTCEEDGLIVYKCTKCNQTREEVLKATGHNWNDGEVFQAAECEKDGIKRYTCLKCDATRDEVIQAIGHEWVLKNTLNEADCETNGLGEYECSRCNVTKTETIPALGHKPGEVVRENVVDASCTQRGSHEDVVYCTECQKEISRTFVDDGTLPHNPGEEVMENVNEQDGSYDKVIYCTKCQAEISRVHVVPGTVNDGTVEGQIWAFLKNKGFNDYAVAGIMGNLYAESGLKPTNLQDGYNESLGLSDDEYTDAVDNGSYKNFETDEAGYGLAQWVYSSRKAGLQAMANEMNRSVGDLEVQLEYFFKEIKAYATAYSVLQNAKTVREASDVMLKEYEAPEDWNSEETAKKREEYSMVYYNKYANLEDVVHVHTWDEGTIIDKASCTENGLIRYTCKDCKETRDEVVPMLAHEAGEPQTIVVEEGNCTTARQEAVVTYCIHCNKELSRENKTIPAEGHKWDEGKVTKKASCTEDGMTLYTCKNCSEQKTEIIKSQGHVPGEAKVIDSKEASCEEDGYKTTAVYCTVCNEELSRNTEILKASGHEGGEPVEIEHKDALCEEDGYSIKAVYCKHCNAELSRETETIKASGHEGGEPVEIEHKDATCEEDGYSIKVVYCKHCNEEISRETVVLKAEGHEAGEPVEIEHKDASCEEDGYIVRATYCAHCNKEMSRDTETIPATGHQAGEPHVVVRKDPTCTEDGYEIVETSCVHCNNLISRERADIPASGHEAGEPVVVDSKDASCEEDGYIVRVTYCAHCNAEISRNTETIQKLGHQAGEPVVVDSKDASCTEDGYITSVIYCTRCDGEISRSTETIPATGHEAGETVVLESKDASCEEDGYIIRVTYCAHCNAEISRDTETVPATGHQAGASTVVERKDPTCTEDGYEIVETSCAHCGNLLSRERTVIPATGHRWNTGTVTKKPNCTESGIVTFTCLNSGETREEVIPAYGHRSGTATVIDSKDATCTEDGYVVKAVYCTRCKIELSRNTETVPAHGHQAGEPVVVDSKDASCLEDGYITRATHCIHCNEEMSRETETIKALGHQGGEPVEIGRKDASCTEDGYVITAVYCTRCNEELSRETETIKSPGHQWDEGVITKEPTYDEEGTMLFTCTVCGATSEESLPKLEAETLMFSLEAGSYTDEQDVSLYAPSGYSIYYTLDGSDPTAESTLYEAPIHLTADGNRWVNSTTSAAMTEVFDGKTLGKVNPSSTLPSASIIRAVAIGPNGEETDVVTKTYYIGGNFTESFENAIVISVVTDPDNLLDYNTGILVAGAKFDEWKNTPEAQQVAANDEWWKVEGNFSQLGDEWKRPASYEMFDGENGLTLQIDGSLQVAGCASRRNAQKSFNFIFDNGYLEYAMFPNAVNEATGEAISVFDEITPRDGGNDTEYLKFKDAWIQSRLADYDFSTQDCRLAVVFLNGEYWGHYSLLEKYSEKYFEEHYNVSDPILVNEESLFIGDESGMDAFAELKAFADKDLSDEAVWEEFKGVMDVQSMADYFAAEIYIGQSDWHEEKNIGVWRAASVDESNPYADGRWRYIVYDTEYSSNLYGQEKTSVNYNTLTFALEKHPLFAAAMQNYEFRAMVAESMNRVADESFGSDAMKDFDAWAAKWKPFMANYYTRFGNSSWAWNKYVNDTKAYFKARKAVILGYLNDYALTFIPENMEVTFSVEAGTYMTEQSLELAAPEGCKIYYTLDGSVPSADSTLYTAPITLTSEGNRWITSEVADELYEFFAGQDITKVLPSDTLPAASVVRAVAIYKDGTKSDVVTKTYLIGNTFQNLFGDKMVLSIVTDPENLLDYNTGILVPGAIYDEWKVTSAAAAADANGEQWRINANFTQHGKAWERPSNLEIFDGEETLTLSAPVGIRVRGAASRTLGQKGFNVYFKKDYGMSKLKYPLIDGNYDIDGNTVQQYKQFVLRNGGNETDYMKFKDAWIQSRIRDYSFTTQRADMAIVFLNGEYWGHLVMMEKYNEDFFKNHYGLSNVLFVKDGEVDVGEDAEISAYNQMNAYGWKDLSNPTLWNEFKNLVDVQNMSEYFAVQVYIGNTDMHTNHNYGVWRSKDIDSSNPYADGKWRFAMYDTEYSIGAYMQEKTQPQYNTLSLLMKNVPLFGAAMKNEEFQEMFRASLKRVANESFGDDALQDFDAWEAEWRPYMNAYYERFGLPEKDLDSCIGSARNFLSTRKDYIFGYLNALIGEEEPQTIPECEHVWDEGVQTVNPSCEESGIMHFTCTLCGETKDEVIEKFGHQPGEAVNENVNEATCHAGGSYDVVVYCEFCSKELSRETVQTEQLEHVPGDVRKENITEPTLTEAGSADYVVRCTLCDDVLSSEHVDYQALGEYGYTVEVANIHSLVTDEFVVFHIITDNDVMENISVKTDSNLTLLAPQNFADINFVKGEDGNVIKSESGTFRRVSDGWVFCKAFKDAGEHYLKLMCGNEVLAEVEFEVVDAAEVNKAWREDFEAKNWTDEMTNIEKLDKAFAYVVDNFRYQSNDGTYLRTMLRDMGPYSESLCGDCWTFTNIMISFAEDLGLEGESTYAGYANHRYATIKIDEETTRVYDAPITSDTGCIKDEDIVYVIK